ncbi:MAG TPA: hypothetical protein VFP91_19215 [Vicinamibacterales bacterium]|nr:hypothetical protein [Vicinamibacterales bacterium]
MRTLIVGGIAALALAAGVGRSQETAAKPDMHAMMAGQHQMMMSMQASDKKLDDLIAQLNAAKGNDRIDKLVAVVNELVAERKQMANMMSMHGGMMQHMMETSDRK